VSNWNVNRGVFLLTLVLATTLCLAAPRCPAQDRRQATIGGDTITGGVLMHKKPLKFAKVRLYFSSGTTAWKGTTDNNGRFATTKMPPGDYCLEVSGWGSTTIHLNPELNKGPFGQTPAWNLLLLDNASGGTMEIVN
jgi:hypothetical protein